MPDLTELRRLWNNGTEAPWIAWDSRRITGGGHYHVADAGVDADAHLIAAAVNALPDLLDAAEALERVKALTTLQPVDELWQIVVDAYRETGYPFTPKLYERMFWATGFQTAMGLVAKL